MGCWARRVGFLLILLIAVMALVFWRSPLLPQARAGYAVSAAYGSIPKGLTLEGVASGLAEKLTSVDYSRKGNYFLINETVVYRSPVPREALRELTKALRRDDRLGVSLLESMDRIVYGGLHKRDGAVEKLIAADKLIGGVVLGRLNWIKGVKLPGDYKPKVPEGVPAKTVIYANLAGFAFVEKKRQDPETKRVTKHYERSAFRLDLSLIPISSKRAPDGGFLPDIEKLNRGDLQPEFVTNLEHFEEHKDTYLAMASLVTAVQYAEAAAFLRYLKQAKVDLKQLEKLFR